MQLIIIFCNCIANHAYIWQYLLNNNIMLVAVHISSSYRYIDIRAWFYDHVYYVAADRALVLVPIYIYSNIISMIIQKLLSPHQKPLCK